MKKFIIPILTLLIATNVAIAETYTIDSSYQRNKSKNYGAVGLSTRFGYGFNYDAFTYGVSLYYHGNGILGFTAGFDGYYIPKGFVLKENGGKYNIPLPLWNIRAGIMISKYFVIGPMIGKSNVSEKEYNLLTLETKSNALFSNDIFTGNMYGGFITIMLPISKYVGFNFDFSLNNKMGFNACAGINIQIPLKTK